MYSGTTLRNKSGRYIGAHQKIDRVARRQVKPVLPSSVNFPSSKNILHFEGKNGPDGVKRKTPGKDELWHYIDPAEPEKGELLEIIENHIVNLGEALASDNQERSAFEAAWLAHAVVDGLTPPHHYPLEEKLEELRGGEGLETRNNFKQKVVMPGDTRREQLKNNWEFWGTKGVMTKHFMFEIEVATTLAASKMSYAKPGKAELDAVKKRGFVPVYLEQLMAVHQLNLYERFYEDGWSKPVAKSVKTDLLPTIIRTVALAWYAGAHQAAKSKRTKS